MSISLNSPPERMAFEDIYETYYLQVLKYVNARLLNYHKAEELTAEIFETLYRYDKQYDPKRSSVSTWVFLVAKSQLRNYYRKKTLVLVDLDAANNVIKEDDSGISAIEEAERIQGIRDGVARALKELDERSRRAIILKYFKGYSCEEVAKDLGISSGNARVIISRGVAKMKTFFNKEEIENMEECIYGEHI